jgi:cytochrome c5
MKKIFLFVLIAALFFTACKSKNASKSTASATPAADSFEANLTAAKTKFPDVTMDVIKKGHGIYYGACTRCHGAKDIARRDEKEWVGVLDDMAPKAKLTPEEKDAVWKYIMSVKLMAAK